MLSSVADDSSHIEELYGLNLHPFSSSPRPPTSLAPALSSVLTRPSREITSLTPAYKNTAKRTITSIQNNKNYEMGRETACPQSHPPRQNKSNAVFILYLVLQSLTSPQRKSKSELMAKAALCKIKTTSFVAISNSGYHSCYL